jgi:hypothetical protein
MSDLLVPFLQAGIFPPPPLDYEPGSPLALYGYTDGSRPRERGAARLRITETQLLAEGAMFDGDLFSKADGDQQKLWELGDAFEFMIQLPGRRDYHEFQTSPTGFRLQLHIDDCRTFRAVPHEDKLCDCGLEVSNAYDADTGLWRSEMRVPLAALGVSRQQLAGARFVFVRQNHARTTPRPEITASQIFPQTAHEPSFWQRLPGDLVNVKKLAPSANE